MSFQAGYTFFLPLWPTGYEVVMDNFPEITMIQALA